MPTFEWSVPNVWRAMQLRPEWPIAGIGLLCLFVPTLWDLFSGIWATDQQGHGPIVLAIAIWLMARKSPALAQVAVQPGPVLGSVLFVVGLLSYVLGRSQQVIGMEVGAFVVLLLALLVLLHGWGAVRALGFGLFFLMFMVPLPQDIVDALTQPMKMGVSYVTEEVLNAAGYPISRTGVMLQIGQYQLLVADACAGLHTLFTLEALGLLYLNLVRHESLVRNLALALLIVPISFMANVIRVMVLTLITYHFGDEAGQGYLHGFAGMILFLAALLLIMGTDGALRWVVRLREKYMGRVGSMA